MSQLSKGQEIKIIKLYKKGLSRHKIETITGHSQKTVNNVLQRNGINAKSRRTHRIYKINEKFFDKWSKDMAYILGYIATDGNVFKETLSIRIQLKDKEILEYMINHIGNVKLEINEKENWARIRFNSKYLVSSLEKYNITPNKSFIVRAPPNVPKQYIGDYIRGVIDGDGWIGERKCGVSCGIYSASEKFIFDIQEMIGNIGTIKYKSYENDPIRSPQWHLTIQNNKKMLELRSIIYHDPDSFGLARKKKILFSNKYLSPDYIPQIGEGHCRAKLTNKKVKNIKKLIRQGKLTRQEIGDLYSVSADTISEIATGKRWTHIK
jgi:hypothetical protein